MKIKNNSVLGIINDKIPWRPEFNLYTGIIGLIAVLIYHLKTQSLLMDIWDIVLMISGGVNIGYYLRVIDEKMNKKRGEK
jgi:hypothetical protein